eukprot:8869338-Heterocapsa_arctica.AAC.2
MLLQLSVLLALARVAPVRRRSCGPPSLAGRSRLSGLSVVMFRAALMNAGLSRRHPNLVSPSLFRIEMKGLGE